MSEGLMDKTLTDALALAAHYGVTDRAVAVAVEAVTQAHRDAGEQPGRVAMTHPDLPDRPQLVDPEAFEVYERSGWQLAASEALKTALDKLNDEAGAVTVKATKTTAKKEK
jgi:hypothetical protein